jgi:hypothetical protein
MSSFQFVIFITIKTSFIAPNRYVRNTNCALHYLFRPNILELCSICIIHKNFANFNKTKKFNFHVQISPILYCTSANSILELESSVEIVHYCVALLKKDDVLRQCCPCLSVTRGPGRDWAAGGGRGIHSESPDGAEPTVRENTQQKRVK